MCSSSAIMDNQRKMWERPESDFFPYLKGYNVSPTKAEFDALKKEVEALKALLVEAKKFDEATGQPDCEVEDKVALIRKIADIFGVDMKEVFT